MRAGAAAAALAAVVAAALLGSGGLDRHLEAAHAALSGDSVSPAGPPPSTRLAAVVVLGYALDRHGAPSPGLLQRVADGLTAWRRVEADGAALVFSGGAPSRTRARAATLSEAAVMAAAARRMTGGVDSPAWILEEASTSTWENAVFSIRVLTERGALPRAGDSALLVSTSPFHGARSLATFRCALKRAGVNARVALAPARRPPPATPAERGARAAEAVREVAALAWYGARGRLC